MINQSTLRRRSPLRAAAPHGRAKVFSEVFNFESDILQITQRPPEGDLIDTPLFLTFYSIFMAAPRYIYTQSSPNNFPSCLIADDIQIAIPIMKPTLDKVQLTGQTLPPGFPAPFLFADGLSSVETLLTNIQVQTPPPPGAVIKRQQ